MIEVVFHNGRRSRRIGVFDITHPQLKFTDAYKKNVHVQYPGSFLQMLQGFVYHFFYFLLFPIVISEKSEPCVAYKLVDIKQTSVALEVS